MSSRFPVFVLFLLVMLCLPVSGRADAPRVVVSIAPIHSLAAGVMDGVKEPTLLVASDSSPHHYMLKPSQMFSLQRADMVVWVGESVESFMPRVLHSLAAETQVMELMSVPGMTLLPARAGGVWEGLEHQEAHGGHGDVDAHLWLDPRNARLIVAGLVERLSSMDPVHAGRYRANGERLQQRLDALDRELQGKLASVRDVPYLLFHDAYQYLEKRYGLKPVGALMIDPERKPGVRRLSEIRARIASEGVRCVFSEPQFPDKLIQVVTEGSAVRSAALDPMGMELQPGAELYFQLMHQLTRDLVNCLTP